MHAHHHRAVFQTRLFVAYGHDEEPATTRGRMTGPQHSAAPGNTGGAGVLAPSSSHGLRAGWTAAPSGPVAYRHTCRGYVVHSSVPNRNRGEYFRDASAAPWIAGPPEASQFGTVPPPDVIPGATVVHPPPTVLYAIRTCDPAFGRRHRIRLPRAWTEA